MKAKVLAARNPRYANAKKNAIDLEVNFSHLPEEFVLFTASINDVELYGRKLYEMAVNGDFGEVQDSP